MPAVTQPTLIFADNSRPETPLFLQYEELHTEEVNSVSYDIRLIDEYGNDYSLSTGITLCFPYPNGMTQDTIHIYRINIYHYGEANTEVFSLSDGSITATEQGLCIQVSSFSPFEIVWEKLPENIALPQTGDNSLLTLWLFMLPLAAAALLTLRRKTA